MNLGDYTDLKGAQYRVVRTVESQETLHFEDDKFFIIQESFIELKNCKTGRLEFLVISTKIKEFTGFTPPGDRTAFILSKDAVPRTDEET